MGCSGCVGADPVRGHTWLTLVAGEGGPARRRTRVEESPRGGGCNIPDFFGMLKSQKCEFKKNRGGAITNPLK